MTTRIRSTRVVKTYEYEGVDYNITGDFTTSENGNIVSVSGNIQRGNAEIGTFNAYDYNDDGNLKVNVNNVALELLADVVSACEAFVSEIVPAKTEEEVINEPNE